MIYGWASNSAEWLYIIYDLFIFIGISEQMYIPCMKKEHETHTPYLLSVSIVGYNVYYLFIYLCLINVL